MQVRGRPHFEAVQYDGTAESAKLIAETFDCKCFREMHPEGPDLYIRDRRGGQETTAVPVGAWVVNGNGWTHTRAAVWRDDAFRRQFEPLEGWRE